LRPHGLPASQLTVRHPEPSPRDDWRERDELLAPRVGALGKRLFGISRDQSRLREGAADLMQQF